MQHIFNDLLTSFKTIKEVDFSLEYPFLYLKYIEIHKKYRGQGTGKTIIHAIMDFCSEYQIILYLYPANARQKYLDQLCRFYSRCGMKQIVNTTGFILFIHDGRKIQTQIPVPWEKHS
jgi:GNAT superfamily N-acetyltransferase